MRLVDAELSGDGTVAVTWKAHLEPSRMGCLGTKTEELVEQTDFAYRAGLLQGAVAATAHSHYLKMLPKFPAADGEI